MNNKKAEWILRVAIAGEFLGHGVFALGVKTSWLAYFAPFGINAELASSLLPLIGILDIVMAILVLVKPIRIGLLWMAFWGFLTALIRPIAGEPIWDFVERAANWGAPLALLYVIGWPQVKGDWWK